MSKFKLVKLNMDNYGYVIFYINIISLFFVELDGDMGD